MIKKLLVIILLCILIVANISVCYADNEGYYLWSENNVNITDVNMVYNTNGLLDTLSNLKYQMLDDGTYQAYLSRYSSGFVNLHLTLNVFMRPQYQLVGTISNVQLPQRPNYVISSDYINIIDSNITYSNYGVSSGYDATNVYYFYYSYQLNVDIKCSLRDLIFTQESDYTQNLIYLTDTTSKYGFYLYNGNGAVVGYLVNQYYRNGFNGTMTFTLENSITSVTRACFGFDFYEYNSTYSNGRGFTNSGVVTKSVFNAVTIEAPTRSFLNSFAYFDVTDKSLISTMSTNCQNRIDWAIVSDNYASIYTNNPNLSQNQTQFDLQVALLPPLFLTDDTPVNNIYEDNQTSIQISYYDAKWYEFHKQAANAFIFLITEFPLISDITNLIYSLFVMIQNGFNVLLNFDGFGIIFAFGMFAVVFGFILKLIIGD